MINNHNDKYMCRIYKNTLKTFNSLKIIIWLCEKICINLVVAKYTCVHIDFM